MSEYYTPVIEEFNIEFKYEILGSTGWFDSKVIPILLSVGHIKTLIETKQIRVKYLDEVDIESLGWIKGDFKIFGNNTFTYDNHQLIFKNDLSVEIIKEEIGTIFLGEIKNKSELKKILSFIKIKQKDEN